MENAKVVKKKPRIVCNVGDTQYEVVKHVAKNKQSWILNEDFLDDEWDIEWTDNAVSADKLSKMKPYQKINHFPGMFGICKKNYLAWNLNRMAKMFPNDYNFFPKTWVLPGDWIDFKNSFKPNKYFILKPEASSQGRGIFLVRKIEEVNPNERYVAQEYIKDPLLIDGLKFDLRVYVLVAGCNPLRVYIHEQGLARLATEAFAPPGPGNQQDMCMHLTNYAINKNNSKFVFNEDPESDDVGHKRSLSSTLQYLQTEGYDTIALQKSIEDIIMKTLSAVQPYLAHLYKSCQPDEHSNSMCFELLGFDILLDSTLKPWMLEVNHSPSFTTDSPLDWKIKKKVIRDTMTLLGVKAKTRKIYYKEKKAEVLRRAFTGKTTKDTKEEKAEMARIAQIARDNWENSHLGGFKKLYPVVEDKYEVFIKGADAIYTELTGTNICRIKKTEDSKNAAKPPLTAKAAVRRLNNSTNSPVRMENTTLVGEDPIAKCENNLSRSVRFENYMGRSENTHRDLFEALDNRVTLVQHIHDVAGKHCIKLKSTEIPPLHIQSIKLNKPQPKYYDYNFVHGNYIMPRTFEFSPRMRLPANFRNQEKRINKYKLMPS